MTLSMFAILRLLRKIWPFGCHGGWRSERLGWLKLQITMWFKCLCWAIPEAHHMLVAHTGWKTREDFMRFADKYQQLLLSFHVLFHVEVCYFLTKAES